MPRILLVEDEADVRLVMEHVLIDAGHSVETTATMAGGMAALARYGLLFDLVITDVKLPDGTGIDIADAATEKGVPVILITGYAFTLPPQKMQEYDVLLKPLRPVEIVTAVEQALRDR